jgi:hypothetical protein
MRPAAALLLVLPLALPALAGCRSGTPVAERGQAPFRVGPSLDRLCEVLADPRKSASEKDAYLQRYRGTLVTGQGTITRVSDRLEVECPLKHGTKVCVVARPTAAAATGMGELKPGEAISVSGLLRDRRPNSTTPGACPLTFELSDARITIPMR